MSPEGSPVEVAFFDAEDDVASVFVRLDLGHVGDQVFFEVGDDHAGLSLVDFSFVFEPLELL